ncbi:MAG: FadR family transcriptional regulator [Deltaproteobacteria bacterium]|nr:FadR family transcriptional regulator [Deltaproteobacteria bacterium]
MSENQPHQKALRFILRRIFEQGLSEGAKLPTERVLSAETGVDRTSLRIALKQLESMQVLDIRHGDGIYIKDISEHAGLDLLRLLFLQQDVAGGWLPDTYLLDEIWEFYVAYFPAMLSVALKHITPEVLKELQAILDEELSCIEDRERVVRLELASEELVARTTGNLLFMLISNSSAPLRKRMVGLFVQSMTGDELKKHVANKKRMVKRFTEEGMSADQAARAYGEILASYREKALRAGT